MIHSIVFFYYFLTPFTTSSILLYLKKKKKKKKPLLRSLQTHKEGQFSILAQLNFGQACSSLVFGKDELSI
jgi:hypothetical protein